MRRFRVAAVLLGTQAVLMELSSLVLFGLLLVDVVPADIGGREIFAMPYLQDNLQLMMVMAGIFGALRLTGAIGLWRNRLWGFWLSGVMATVTLVLMIFMMPAGIADGILSGAALVLLLQGYFGDKEIVSSRVSR